MSASEDTTTLLGRYRVLRRLGAGGMATVFLAEDQRLRRQVAIKRLLADSPADTVARLEREARLGASLNHPNLVAVYDTAADAEGVLVVMEYVEGESLSAALRRGPLTPERAAEVVEAVAGALDHAHGAGVVHRDVKPGNVLLGGDGRVKLADLGIAQAAEQTRLTAAGVVLGTASYMSPEQLEGRAVGPEADVYALAAVAFEAISGRRARSGSTPVEVAHRIASGPPPDVRDLVPRASPAMAAALARGMARDPAARPRSAGELARELSAAIVPSAIPATDPGPATEPIRPGRAPAPRRRGLASSLAVAALAITLGATVVLLGQGDDPEQPSPPEKDAPEAGGQGGGASAQAGTDVDPAETSLEPLFATDGVGDPARGAALNAQGKALVDRGQPEAAVPILVEAVRSFPEGTDDIQYAYALYNLGEALLRSGRPEEAIPILERRLQIPDQPGVVRATLREARAAAGG